MRAPLPEAVSKKFYLYLWRDALIEHVVDGIEDRHVDMQVTVDLLHTLSAEIALSDHLHLYLCALHAVAFSYHGTEGSVTGEL